MPVHRPGRQAVLLAALLGLSGLTSGAGLYRWQDDAGQWHFTDRPPAGMSAQPPSAGATSAPARLDERLAQRFQPGTPIEWASLAVVAIKTPLSTGSGFFISPQGHLLTNRHVVRPEQGPAQTQATERLARAEAQLAALAGRLDQERAYLDAAQAELQRMAETLEGDRHDSPRHLDYQARQGRYQQRLENYHEQRQTLERQQRDLRQRRAELGFQHSAATLRRQFTLTLKDGSELRARLLTLARDQDLALLKVEGQRTPYIEAADAASPGQGTPVYAIGSPWGMQDAVTAGVITRSRDDYLVSDTQVQPGNSGGPLLDEQGRWLGVNTARLGRAGETAGFGLAIPVNRVRQALGELP